MESEGGVFVETPQTTGLLSDSNVRAVLALILVSFTLIGGFVLLAKGTIDFDKFLALQGVPGVALGYYFGKR